MPETTSKTKNEDKDFIDFELEKGTEYTKEQIQPLAEIYAAETELSAAQDNPLITDEDREQINQAAKIFYAEVANALGNNPKEKEKIAKSLEKSLDEVSNNISQAEKILASLRQIPETKKTREQRDKEASQKMRLKTLKKTQERYKTHLESLH